MSRKHPVIHSCFLCGLFGILGKVIGIQNVFGKFVNLKIIFRRFNVVTDCGGTFAAAAWVSRLRGASEKARKFYDRAVFADRSVPEPDKPARRCTFWLKLTF